MRVHIPIQVSHYPPHNCAAPESSGCPAATVSERGAGIYLRLGLGGLENEQTRIEPNARLRACRSAEQQTFQVL